MNESQRIPGARLLPFGLALIAVGCLLVVLTYVFLNGRPFTLFAGLGCFMAGAVLALVGVIVRAIGAR